MSPILQLEGVGKTYALDGGLMSRLTGRGRSRTAVADVDLTLQRGDVLGVVGESGCGKSTLARMILRMETPTAGRIRFDGTDITGLSGSALLPVRKRMQMVFQDPGASLNPRKRVRRVLGESLGLAGIPREARADAAVSLLERVGLAAAQLDRYPHELSGGQRQRVAIARALAMSPDLIVADEPVSALDVSLQAQIMRLLMRLRDELGLTLVFISHDLALVHHLCNEVVVMQAGRIVERGTPATVLHHPAHAYTRILLDAIPRVGVKRQQRMNDR